MAEALCSGDIPELIAAPAAGSCGGWGGGAHAETGVKRRCLRVLGEMLLHVSLFCYLNYDALYIK